MYKIGWRRYMERMILSEELVMQAECVDLGGCSLSLDNWAKELAIKLLEGGWKKCSAMELRYCICQ